MARALIEVEVYLHHETSPGDERAGAYLVSLDDDKDEAVWVPKSACYSVSDTSANTISLTLPEHVAKDKGLV
jgi:hypothetical protein